MKKKILINMFLVFCLAFASVFGGCGGATDNGGDSSVVGSSDGGSSAGNSTKPDDSSSSPDSSSSDDPTEPDPEKVWDYVDFTVEVEEGRDPVVLQLTDPQIIDSSQVRNVDRFGAGEASWYAEDKKEERCFGFIRETVETTNPDLIIMTGDIVYGEFDDTGSSLLALVEFMESLEVPWAPVFGNHDQESKKGADWQCKQFEDAEHCLFKQRTLTGNGNYTVGIKQGGKLTRTFFMMDSNGCGAASSQSLANGHTKTTVGFGNDQIKWYTDCVGNIKKYSPETKLSMAFHIQLDAFKDAYAKYGYINSRKSINIDLCYHKDEGDFGYLCRELKNPWDTDRAVWNGLKALGFDSIFVGHEHSNSASVVYEGIRCQYGQKSSTYDRENWVISTGTISPLYPPDPIKPDYVPLIGGTVIPLSRDGSLNNPYIYLCKDAGGDIDWSSWPMWGNIEIAGLDLTQWKKEAAGISIEKVTMAGEKAYKISASAQLKLYAPLDLINAAQAISFDVYVPTGTPKLAGLGEFAFRRKPLNDYIAYNSGSTEDDTETRYKLTLDRWCSFSAPCTFSEAFTEYSLIIPEGATIYIKNVTIE